MKRLYYFIGAAALMAVAMTVSPAMNAQENGNRDENGKIVRGPYETNRFGDNWFIGVAGGVNLFLNEGYEPAFGPSIDANFGKWFTPSVGMRMGYQGLSSKAWSDAASVLGTQRDADNGKYAQKFGYMYIMVISSGIFPMPSAATRRPVSGILFHMHMPDISAPMDLREPIIPIMKLLQESVFFTICVWLTGLTL